jgi:hypothetical protein
VIGAFIIPVNDRMPHEVRQRLKPFAPRIIGTRDGCDTARIAVLHAVMAAEILPGLTARLGRARDAAPRRGMVARFWAMLRRRSLQGHARRLLDEVAAGPRPERELALARAAGQLLARSACLARDSHDAAWLWNAAIGLLDRMCDVGRATRAELQGCGTPPLRPAAADAEAPPGSDPTAAP